MKNSDSKQKITSSEMCVQHKSRFCSISAQQIGFAVIPEKKHLEKYCLLF